MNTFAIHTLGCKVNLYESNLIRNDLLSLGMIEVPFNEKADIYIINSCSVTSAADAKSKNIISRPKRLNKDAIVIVMGCYSQTSKDDVCELDVDIIIGNKYKSNIIDLINEYKKNNKKLIKVENLMIEKDFETSKVLSFKENTRAFIKIQDGCNFMCSYCIIPFSRGRQRSKQLNDVIVEINELVSSGYKEIVLTGVNTAGYFDKQGNNFFDLLKSISNLKGDFRVRISSVEPFQINDDIVNLITLKKERFCQHWHICLQSASDNVLKAMNRKYTFNEFLELINKIKKLSPDSTFTTDYIVGFSSETLEDHKISMENLKKINFLDMHIFPFSIRKGTMAEKLKPIDSSEKSRRFKEIKSLSEEINKNVLDSFIGKSVNVLFETCNDKQDKWKGYSSEYIEVIVQSNENLKNKILPVKIIKRVCNNLIGEIIK